MIKLAVIGDPIEHSLSPLVHGATLDFLGLDYEYEKIQVKKGDLSAFLSYAKKQGIDGFNLTMPHKVDIIPLLDDIEIEAEEFQSVNTVKIQNGKFHGYNTDAVGYLSSLKEKGVSVKKGKVVILGAGGVARTLALKFALEGVEDIVICNRTIEKAREVAAWVQGKSDVRIRCGDFSCSSIGEAVEGCNLLVQATPLGMDGVTEDFGDLSFMEKIPPNALVSDLIYRPEKTGFLRRAEEVGLSVMNGFGMLIYQGILADEIYLGQELEREKVFRFVYEKVTEKLNQ